MNKLAAKVGAWNIMGKVVIKCDAEIGDLTFQLNGEDFAAIFRKILNRGSYSDLGFGRF